MAATYARSSCGYCEMTGPRRCQRCPGSLPHARAGKEWVCWCAENGHPEAHLLPKPPKAVKEEPSSPPAGTGQSVPDQDATAGQHASADNQEARRPAKGSKEKAPRCGHPTNRGPCKRIQGHTAGHDGR